MQRQVHQLEEKYKDIAQLKTMKEQVEELKKERVWAEVIDAEKVILLKLADNLCHTVLQKFSFKVGLWLICRIVCKSLHYQPFFFSLEITM